jgi:hypothetical protein
VEGAAEAARLLALSLRHYALSELAAMELEEVLGHRYSVLSAIEEAGGGEGAERLAGAVALLCRLAERAELAEGEERRRLLGELAARAEEVIRLAEGLLRGAGERARAVRA